MTSEKKTQYFCFAVVVLHVSVDRKKTFMEYTRLQRKATS